MDYALLELYYLNLMLLENKKQSNCSFYIWIFDLNFLDKKGGKLTKK